jgi:hypothetical protein
MKISMAMLGGGNGRGGWDGGVGWRGGVILKIEGWTYIREEDEICLNLESTSARTSGKKNMF